MIYNYDRVADRYDATRGIPGPALAAVVAGLGGAANAVADEVRLLEVGIGTGRIAVPLAEAGVRITGLDVSRRMLERLRARRPGIPVVIAEAGSVPFRPGAFDAVLFVHILHLVPDSARALESAAAALGMHGTVLLGRTAFDPSPLEEVRRLLDRCVEEVTGEPLAAPRRFGEVEVYTEQLRRLGFECGPAAVLARWTEPSTAREALEAIADRRNSNTWNVPEWAVPEIVRRLEPALDALLGGLDRVHESRARFELITARR